MIERTKEADCFCQDVSKDPGEMLRAEAAESAPTHITLLFTVLQTIPE